MKMILLLCNMKSKELEEYSKEVLGKIEKMGLKPSEIVRYTRYVDLPQASKWLKDVRGGKGVKSVLNLLERVCNDIERLSPDSEKVGEVEMSVTVPLTPKQQEKAKALSEASKVFEKPLTEQDVTDIMEGVKKPEPLSTTEVGKTASNNLPAFDNGDKPADTVLQTETPDNLAKPKTKIDDLKKNLGLKTGAEIPALEKPAESVYEAFEKFTLDPSDFIIVEVRNSECKYLQYPNTFRKEGNIIKFKLTKSIMEFTIPDGLVDKVEFTKDARRCRLTGEFSSDMGDITDVDYPDNPELKGKADKALNQRVSAYHLEPEDYEIVAQPYYGPFVDCDEKRFVKSGVVIHFKYNKEFFVVTMEEGKRIILFEQGGVWYQAASTANFGVKQGSITVTKK